MTDNFQLSDLAFQRHILVQALILIDFLLTLTEGSKSKPFYQNAQKAMQYSFTLREEDVSSHRLPHFLASVTLSCSLRRPRSLSSQLTIKHRPSGHWASRPPLQITCRKAQMANSTTGWWIPCFRATKTGCDGRWRTASHSLETECPQQIFNKPSLGHRKLSLVRKPRNPWAFPVP